MIWFKIEYRNDLIMLVRRVHSTFAKVMWRNKKKNWIPALVYKGSFFLWNYSSISAFQQKLIFLCVCVRFFLHFPYFDWLSHKSRPNMFNFCIMSIIVSVSGTRRKIGRNKRIQQKKKENAIEIWTYEHKMYAFLNENQTKTSRYFSAEKLYNITHVIGTNTKHANLSTFFPKKKQRIIPCIFQAVFLYHFPNESWLICYFSVSDIQRFLCKVFHYVEPHRKRFIFLHLPISRIWLFFSLHIRSYLNFFFFKRFLLHA